MLNIDTPLSFTAGYQYYGPNFYAPHGRPRPTNLAMSLSAQGTPKGSPLAHRGPPCPPLTLYANYLTGNNVSNGQSERELETEVIYQLVVNASITLLYRDLQMAGIDQLNLYRAKLNYRF